MRTVTFGATALTGKTDVKVSVQFTHELSQEEIVAIEKTGVRFHRLHGRVIHFGLIYGARVPWEALDDLAGRATVVRIESMWLPVRHAPLDVSVPEIHADKLWSLYDNNGKQITGKGVIIADFDTGIDVFHPLFWQIDSSSYEWIDNNGNGSFDPGIDGVDLNGNEQKDDGETLSFLDVNIWDSSLQDIREPGFQTSVDWLYCDANDNATRDSGKNSGFAETDPAFGEQIFDVEDVNKNGKLDVGEHLIALKTSKVIATMNTDSIERLRGENLIDTEPDTNGHGTGVCGILGGGSPGLQKYVGVAPDAELVVANIYWDVDIDWVEYMAWAEEKGARVMLHEIGSWVSLFLDGSSHMETAIDEEAAKGIVQVVPAGNLGGARRHAHSEIGAGQTYDLTFKIPRLQQSI
ncbi:MAG: S8 family serine peptidase, partial [Proteobacteria bacterium]|nr:S8 family serine peptidase [Pseudomonadota bacterium]